MRRQEKRFNINSPKQLGVILFEKTEIATWEEDEDWLFNAQQMSLISLHRNIQLSRRSLEYRQLTKLKSTYADGLANYICADGRIHGKFNQTIHCNWTNQQYRTESPEHSGSDGTWKRLIRKVFIPERGVCICGCRLFTRLSLEFLHIARGIKN